MLALLPGSEGEHGPRDVREAPKDLPVSPLLLASLSSKHSLSSEKF